MRAGVSASAGGALNRVDDAVVHVAHPHLVPREQEHRDREHGEDDAMNRAVDRDDAQHDAISQRLATERKLDLVARRWKLARRR